MGRKKTQLLARDQYARLIAALRCAELIRTHATGRGPVELHLEDSRFSPWDDLTELHRDESGRTTWHVWQVKRQREPLAQQKFRPLLKKLGERPELIAHLAIYQPVSVRGLGSLSDLDEVCQRVRKRGFDPAAELEWSQDETKWLEYVRALLGSQESALALLRRLHIDVYGSEAKLREDTEVRLERYFVAPAKVLERLLAFIADNTDQAVRYDNALLEGLLRDFERHPNLGAVPPAALRQVYLSVMNRAMLFRGIVERLFSDWARHRKPHEGAPPLSWATIAPSFRQLALASLKEGKEDLKLTDLRKHLGSKALDHELEWVDEAHRRFGLLMYQEDGRYRFLLKGIAEHLAGAELLACGPGEILQAARKKWGEEPVRHALGLGLEREGVAWVTDMLRKLLPGPAGVQVQEVRPLLVAAQVCLDLGETGAPLAEPIAEALCKLLTLETSFWIQKEVGEVVRGLARLGGPCWDALLRRLAPTLQARGVPAQWYAAQAHRDKGWWLEALKHRDLDVRRIAVEHLTPWVNDPQVRDALIQQLGDSSYSPFSEPPVLRAGLALRGAERDEDFQRLLPSLVMQARQGGQILGGAAVLALRPSEAPTRLLADRLHHLHMGLWKYPEVLKELTRSPEAEAEVEAVWQGWRSDIDKPPKLPDADIEPLDGPIVPLSQQTRRQVLWAIGPALARWSPEQWRQFGISFDDRILALALCEAVWDHPEGILNWLKHSKSSWLTPDAELLLGEAAIRHPALRSALLDRWENRQAEHERSLFPGGALASLIARSDQEAAEIYARWLRVTPWLQTGFESVFLSPTALRHPLVRPVATEQALDTWRQFSEGEIKDGKRTTLYGGVMASILGALRPAWEDSTPLMQKLIHLARKGDGEDLTHALAVFSRPPYPRELGDILVERFEEFAEKAGDDHRGHVGFWIDWAQRASIVDRMQTALEKVCTWKTWHHYPAALALLAIEPRQASRLSQEAAQNWPDDWDLFFLRPSMIARLARANVSAWYQRWREVMSQDALPIRSVFELGRILAPLLSPNQQEELYRELRSRLGKLETYWIQGGENPWDCIRLTDLYAQVLFEAGT